MKAILLFLLRLYQLAISPYLGQNCRFHPSCSDYARQAVGSHGALRGTLLAGRRLCKCHPWHPGGVDPVPPATPSRQQVAATASTLPFSLQPGAAAADTDTSFRPIAD